MNKLNYEKAPSSRVVFYDLSGTEVGFECEAFLNAGSIGSKILCSCVDKLIVFDTLTKEKRDYTPRGFVAYGNVVMLYDSSYYDVKGIVILDRNLQDSIIKIIELLNLIKGVLQNEKSIKCIISLPTCLLNICMCKCK